MSPPSSNKDQAGAASEKSPQCSTDDGSHRLEMDISDDTEVNDDTTAEGADSKSSRQAEADKEVDEKVAQSSTSKSADTVTRGNEGGKMKGSRYGSLNKLTVLLKADIFTKRYLML
mgnify:CR=1 FL=1